MSAAAAHRAVQEAIDAVNAERSRHEQIKRFTIVPREFSADHDEVTPTLKLKRDRKSTRLNSSHSSISYAVFCLKKKIINIKLQITRLFSVTEKMRLALSVEAFNVFNRTQITAVTTRLYSIGDTSTSYTLTYDPA